MAKDHFKMIYVFIYLVAANLLFLIAFSAIRATIQGNDSSGLKLVFLPSLKANIKIKSSSLLDLSKLPLLVQFVFSIAGFHTYPTQALGLPEWF